MANNIDVDDVRRAEKMDGYLISTPGNDLVHFIIIKVQRTDTVVEFYRKLGYEDKSKLPGWRDMMPDPGDTHVYMVRSGPRTCVEVRKGRCPWADPVC